ncbi:hypothetical protein DY000_02010448 [Brassica cretica]|uniref:Uncharacterized protein n=1 Tax=Brassica cretica TaxID=69181 RepID=A0ABQ7CHH2_BRACR|nr:hypothetical protein DY000_02010448 [Brassica cretica]
MDPSQDPPSLVIESQPKSSGVAVEGEALRQTPTPDPRWPYLGLWKALALLKGSNILVPTLPSLTTINNFILSRRFRFLLREMVMIVGVKNGYDKFNIQNVRGTK